MGLRRIAAKHRWWPAKPQPQVPTSLRRGRLLVRIANAAKAYQSGGCQVDVSNPDVAFLIERGFITVRREAVGTAWPGPHQLRRTRAKITDAGWEAVWAEDLGGDRPLAKSERVERSSHQARRA
ncbi:hypothetical protein BAJUN_00680 [Bajunvirus bajun]|uniref:Uncharacterized protein n=1 Tax=Brevundimonas phage vB_BgoS-Bajun TaxID=2948594 RepID=A0A9E7N6K6_9CAUD|nr:hypothetical protein BAJUN_00680 [Brevundimonas phage vB_BgoS-Bajun]